jgi:hypothetical protein
MRIALALLLMCGCNQIFGLEGGSGDDDQDPDGPRPDGPPPDGRPGDLDSDGVLDGVDSCPSHFNPLQADEDADAEINGGDACDPCPHRGSMPAGAPHLDSDGDGLGDECDPDNSVWHCLRWFDGFSEGGATAILARYRRSGGIWNVDLGAMVQGDPVAAAAELTIDGLLVGSPFVATQGRMDQLPTTGPIGNMPYRNTLGVLLGAEAGASACFASVTRDVDDGLPSAASVMLSSRTNSEIVSSTFLMGGGMVPMNAGERFGVTFDGLGVPSSPVAVGALFDRGASDSTGGFLACAPGGGGLRTSFASGRFEYLLVLERGTAGTTCPARLPPAPPL